MDPDLCPRVGLPFAGHSVLGTAFVVSTALGKEKGALETGAGLIPVQLEHRNGRPVFGRMQQPIRECEPYERERELLDALGVMESGLPVELYRSGAPHVFVAFESEDEVAALKPDFAALEGLGIAANCFSGSGHSWKTRSILESNRNVLGQLLRQHLPEVRYRAPQAGYLAWIDCRALGLSPDPATRFLLDGKVALKNGIDFGASGSGLVRLNFGTSPELLAEIVQRMPAAAE